MKITAKGEYKRCYTTRPLCYKQIIPSEAFKSSQRNEGFYISHQVSCKSNYVMYFLVVPYAKSSMEESPKHHNNIGKKIKNNDAIEASNHFNTENHCFKEQVYSY